MRLTLATLLAAAAGLVFTGTASAHNISVSAAKAKCKTYVHGVFDETNFIQAKVSAVPAFSGHNHYVRCTVSYDTAKTQPTKYYACTETLDVYYLPENADRTRTMFMRHITRNCGPERLRGPQPG